MAAERRFGLRRRHQRAEEEPETVVAEMEAATQRLRDQAWKINATTKAPMIPEASLRTDDELTEGPRRPAN